MWHPENPTRHTIPETRWPTQEEAHSRYFPPAEINSIAIENRAWVPAMVPWRATEMDSSRPTTLIGTSFAEAVRALLWSKRPECATFRAALCFA